jgi:type IV secretion system protein TrbI
MMSVFGSLGQLSQPHQATNQLTMQQMIYAAIGQQLTQTGSQLIAKNMNIQPTIKIRPGDEFNVLLTRDMVLPSAYKY